MVFEVVSFEGSGGLYTPKEGCSFARSFVRSFVRQLKRYYDQPTEGQVKTGTDAPLSQCRVSYSRVKGSDGEGAKSVVTVQARSP